MNRIWIGLCLVCLSIGLFTQQCSKSEAHRALANLKAELAQKDSELVNSRKMYQLTIDELKNSQDSIISLLGRTADSLRIKPKRIIQMQYMESKATRIDTIRLSDTIFVEGIKIDTTIKDDWYKLDLSLSYPNVVSVEPTFRSEKNVIISYTKETKNPPKKFWLFRLFQRKHKVIMVDVVEKSPYIESIDNKFIQVVK